MVQSVSLVRWTALLMAFALMMDLSSALICHCDSRYCPTETCHTNGVCFVSLKRSNKDDSVDRVTRCLDREHLIPPERPFVCEYSLKNNHSFVSKCCKDSNNCNEKLVLHLAPQIKKEEVVPLQDMMDLSLMKYQIILAAVIPVVVVILVLFPLLYLYRRKRSSHSSSSSSASTTNLRVFHCCALERCCRDCREVESVETQSTTYPASSINDYMSVTTGSGSGLPLLVQRSVARQINLGEVVGKGRFGEVWKGMWRGEKVAVKIFSSVDEKSWFREVEIYQTVMLRHPNVLGFIAADNKDNGTWTQLWLIMEYMEKGSLYDYLNVQTLTPAKLIEMSLCIAAGLAHLHMEIVGTHGKPAIAHRDLKSKNILVRGDGSCAIGDLGLAVRYNQETNMVDLPQNSKVGTKRYLAPELLNESLNTSDFEAFKKADVYSLGLVLWEMSMRCKVPPHSVPNHFPPYSEIVGEDPSIEEMKKVVCTDGARPTIPNHWTVNPTLNKMATLVSECWYETASSRLTSLRVKKTLTELRSSTLKTSKESSTIA